jgi:hypothetical protein
VARLSDAEYTKVWSVKSAHVFSVSRHWYFMSMHIPSHTHRFGWSQTPHSLKVLSPCQVMLHFNWFMGHHFAVQCRFMCTMKYTCVWWWAVTQMCGLCIWTKLTQGITGFIPSHILCLHFHCGSWCIIFGVTCYITNCVYCCVLCFGACNSCQRDYMQWHTHRSSHSDCANYSCCVHDHILCISKSLNR